MNTKAFTATHGAFDWREENKTARRAAFTPLQPANKPSASEWPITKARRSGLKPVLFLLAASFLAVALTRADVITDWNDTAIKVFKAAGVGGPAPTRPLALVHVAQFDAVNAVNGSPISVSGS